MHLTLTSTSFEKIQLFESSDAYLPDWTITLTIYLVLGQNCFECFLSFSIISNYKWFSSLGPFSIWVLLNGDFSSLFNYFKLRSILMTRRSGDWAPVSIISIWAELPQSPVLHLWRPLRSDHPLLHSRRIIQILQKWKVKRNDRNVENAQTTPYLTAGV